MFIIRMKTERRSQGDVKDEDELRNDAQKCKGRVNRLKKKKAP